MPNLPDHAKVARLTLPAFRQLAHVETVEVPGRRGPRREIPAAGRQRIRGWMRRYFTETPQGREQWEKSVHFRRGRNLEDVLDELMQEVK